MHYAQTLAYDNGSGVFSGFSGSYSELVQGLRIKAQEANGNLYYTTSKGIYKISAKNADDFTSIQPTEAGGIKAIDLSASLEYDVAGFLPGQSKVAYRLVYGTKDNNDNLILGVPSSRVVLTNGATDVNVSEVFTANVLNYSAITDSEYFLFDTPDLGYAVWFDVSGSATPPATADTLSRQLVKVDTQAATNNTEFAAILANTLSATITEITVSISNAEVTITINEPGDVADAGQGTVSSSDLLITKVFDGVISTALPANAELNFTLPQNITTDYFYQVYRTAIATVSPGLGLNDIDPGDEMNMVFEYPITDADITAGEITVIDNTPDNFRAAGALLYTNPISGQGILQANERPPIAQDIALFRNSTFYANTKEVHRLSFSLLSVDDFTSGSTKFYIGRAGSVSEYTFVGVAQVTSVDVLPKSQTVGGSYSTLNSANDENQYYLWMDKGVLSYSFNSTSDVNDATETITINDHGYATNDPIVFTGTVPGGITVGQTYYAIRTDANNFQVSLTVGGPAIDLTDAIGTGIVTHVSADPAVSGRIGIRIPLVVYPDTNQGSIDAVIDTLSAFSDFSAIQSDSDTVTITNTDSGPSTSPTQSTPPSGWTFTVTVPGDGEDDVAREVLLSQSTSPALAIDLTARSLVRVINRDPDCPVFAIYLSGPDDLPGKISLEAKTLEDSTFYIATNDSNVTAEFSPELPVSVTLDSINSTTNVFTTTTPHGLAIGNTVYIQDNPGSAPTEFGGTYTIATVPTNVTFTLANVDVGINQPGPLSGVVFRTTVASTNNGNPNRVYYSKTSQPEAVPLVNYIDVGPKDKQILRILPLRDNLFVLKEDGVYILTGGGAPAFSVRGLDLSTSLIAPDSASVLNNLIYMLSNQGVVTVSDSGVSVISRNIENLIQRVTTFNYNYKYTSFGVNYETDRSYLLWLPTEKSDNIATQCFRFNTFTSTWTRWVLTNTCGIVNFGGNDLLHLGSGSRFFIQQERKNGDRTDYADRDFQLSLGTEAFNGLDVTVSSAADLEVGDVITQTQYVTIPKFNRLLKKLDTDTGPADNNYWESLNVTTGDNLANQLQNLITKLNADPNLGTFTPSSGTNTFEVLRDDYNNLIEELNDPSSGTNLKDYKIVTDLLTYEVLIKAVVRNQNKITINFSTWFQEGAITAYKGIRTVVQYAPQHFGKPEMFKQIHEGTIIFDQNAIYSGTLSYASDRSMDFTDIAFEGEGPGFWISYPWSDVVWGGAGREVPVRTLIPQNKSRCRYLNVKFTHVNAREQYKLLGISLEPREFSTRAYR